LLPGGLYHFRLVASNIAGTTLGTNQSFTAIALAPTVTTLPASSITTTSATLNATVNPGGGAIAAYFQYGLTTNYDLRGPTFRPGFTNVPLPVADLITGLTPARRITSATTLKAPQARMWVSI
jgi:hypothetical protein